MNIENVYVTVGTTKFDKLIATILQKRVLKALKNRGCTRLLIQIGRGTKIPPQSIIEEIEIDYYTFKSDIKPDIINADFIISHAGAGTCLESLEAKKPLLVVINDDLMDNHQTELAIKLFEDGYLHYTTCSNLEQKIINLDYRNIKIFKKGNPCLFANHIDYLMGFKDEK